MLIFRRKQKLADPVALKDQGWRPLFEGMRFYAMHPEISSQVVSQTVLDWRTTEIGSQVVSQTVLDWRTTEISSQVVSQTVLD